MAGAVVFMDRHDARAWRAGEALLQSRAASFLIENVVLILKNSINKRTSSPMQGIRDDFYL